MTSNLFGNPHSASGPSQLSTSRVEDTRLRVLQLLNADPDEFDVVFVANATAGIKLVVEAMRSVALDGFDYAYHQNSHTSLVGVRRRLEIASASTTGRLLIGWAGSDPLDMLRATVPLFSPTPASPTRMGHGCLYRGRIKFGAAMHPGYSRSTPSLDAASLVATSPLDLGSSETAPDFTVLSFYKIFGFPDLGALIVRRQAWPVFSSRRYFGGGTVDMVVCLKEQWHAPKSQLLHESLEDGTLPIHSIIALDNALSVHWELLRVHERNCCSCWFPDQEAPSRSESTEARQWHRGVYGLLTRTMEPVRRSSRWSYCGLQYTKSFRRLGQLSRVRKTCCLKGHPC